MTVEGQRYLEECRKVLKEEQMDAVSMGLDFGLPVSDIQKVVKSNQETVDVFVQRLFVIKENKVYTLENSSAKEDYLVI